MDELTIGDKTYISSKKAAQVTGYAKDYVGQLCREGHVEAKMVGRNWYVLEDSIRAHRFGASAEAVEESHAPREAEEGGTPEPEITSEALNEAVNTPVSQDSWKAATYVAEAPATLPEVAPRRVINLLDADTSEEVAAAPLTEMQVAWKEWFEKRQGETYIESPEVIDAREALEHERVELAVEEVTPAALFVPEVSSALYTPESPVEEETETLETAFEGYEDTPPQAVAIHRSTPRSGSFDMVPKRVASSFESMVPASPVVAHVEEQRSQEGRIVRERVRKTRGKSLQSSTRGSSVLVRSLLVGIMLVSIAVAVAGSGYADAYVKKAGVNFGIFDYLGGTRLISK